MKRTQLTVSGQKFKVPSPDSIEELRTLVATDEDVIVLATFGYHHRVRTLVLRWIEAGKNKSEIQSLLSSYIYHSHTDHPRKRVVK